MAFVSRLPSPLFHVVHITRSQSSAQWGERVPVSRAARLWDTTPQRAGTTRLVTECLLPEAARNIGRSQRPLSGQEVALTPGCGLEQDTPAGHPVLN